MLIWPFISKLCFHDIYEVMSEFDLRSTYLHDMRKYFLALFFNGCRFFSQSYYGVSWEFPEDRWGKTVDILPYRMVLSTNGILYDLGNLLATLFREFLGRPLYHDATHVLGT